MHNYAVRFRKNEESGQSYQSKVGVRGIEKDVGEFVDVSLRLCMEILFYAGLHFYSAHNVVSFIKKKKESIQSLTTFHHAS